MAVASARIEVRVLGPFELMVDGRAISIGSAKQRAVLACLALDAGKVVSCERLCDLVWMKDRPVSRAATLQSLVSRLRAAIASADGLVDRGREVLPTREPGWVLDIEPAAVDALRFAQLTSLARQRTGRGELAAAAADLNQAVSLWRGAALVDIVEEGYLGAQATRLNQARLHAIEDLADADLALGDHGKALAYLEEHAETNPLRERAWGLLMIALYRAGRQAAALRAFQQVRAVLRDDLGLDPSPELVGIEARILRHDPALAAPTSPAFFTAAAAAASSPAFLSGPVAASGPAVPAVAAASSPAAEATQATHAEEFANYSVLVVEDHDFQRRTVVHLLRGVGVNTITDAASGTEALQAIEAGQVPDVIICDIDMPGMDGVEFVERVAERELACGLLITSGLESNVLRAVEAIGRQRGLQILGALEKPLTARRLAEALRHYTRLNQGHGGRSGEAVVTGEELRRALAQGDVTSEFEPRIDLTTGAMSGIEACGRLQAPEGAALPPAVLARALAQEGLLVTFVERLVNDACALLDDVERAGGSADGCLRVAVDVSPLPFSDSRVADRLTNMVRSRGRNPRQFVWEFDDVVLARASRTAMAGLTRLRVKGFALSIRHSGTFPSWSSQLERVPLTALKLDGRLVTAATADPTVCTMIESLLASAGEAGLRVVAAGCDSRATFELLLALGCAEAQGRFFANAMTASELLSWVLAGSPDESLR